MQTLPTLMRNMVNKQTNKKTHGSWAKNSNRGSAEKPENIFHFAHYGRNALISHCFQLHFIYKY